MARPPAVKAEALSGAPRAHAGWVEKRAARNGSPLIRSSSHPLSWAAKPRRPTSQMTPPHGPAGARRIATAYDRPRPAAKPRRACKPDDAAAGQQAPDDSQQLRPPATANHNPQRIQTAYAACGGPRRPAAAHGGSQRPTAARGTTSTSQCFTAARSLSSSAVPDVDGTAAVPDYGQRERPAATDSRGDLTSSSGEVLASNIGGYA